MERKKSTRERKVLLEKKEKLIKEYQTYLQSLRDSIFPTKELIRLTPNSASYPKDEIVEKCCALKSDALSSQMDDAQLQSLSQVIVSTILYVWKEQNSIVRPLTIFFFVMLKSTRTFVGARLRGFQETFSQETCLY